MSALTIKPKWECDRCGDIHDHEYDAEDCCRPEVHQVFLCPTCEDVHEAHDDAVNCCPENEDDVNPYHVDPITLERQGQMRLLP